ncbi:MAG: LamG-like jellyroll fold domain-containing protein [Planctomycetota bacterium]
MPRTPIVLALSLCPLVAPALAQNGEVEPGYQAKEETPFLLHERHLHRHNADHPTVAPDGTRFFTNRRSDVDLPLPEETDAFVFAVFGDRTGGPDSGVNVLADAVRDVNLLEPDLVMTVGDMIDGYNQTDEWMTEMREYKAIMGELICPWFPVAGNHDIYWRGPDADRNRPEGEHEKSYEMHFGPLWYSFTHKGSHFIVLYSDEGNPETGEKSISRADTQVMSDEQKQFLAEALERGRAAQHQFLFLHHPRWLGGRYGEDWNDNVHPMLADAGNVRAVFAGHIHRMRHDFGPNGDDGIEYVTLATVGGGQRGAIPEAGNLHHYHLVTVRPQQIALTAYPVGQAMNVREISGPMLEQINALRESGTTVESFVKFTPEGAARGEVSVTVTNPSDRPVEFALSPASADNRWMFRPDHTHDVLQPGESAEIGFLVGRPEDSADASLDRLSIDVDYDYMAPSFRYSIPTQSVSVPVDLSSLPLETADAENKAMRFDGDDAIRVDTEVASFAPQGSFTIECWFNAETFQGRTGLLAKTESSEYGIFVSNGELWFAAHLGGAYRERRIEGVLETDRWHHIAGVYDERAEELRTYLDGRLIASVAVDPSWSRTINDLPFYIGADVNRGGQPTSFFRGLIDEVRLSPRARYRGDSFVPERRLTADRRTTALYSFDTLLGAYIIDSSGNGHHAEAFGDPEPVAVSN